MPEKPPRRGRRDLTLAPVSAEDLARGVVPSLSMIVRANACWRELAPPAFRELLNALAEEDA